MKIRPLFLILLSVFSLSARPAGVGFDYLGQMRFSGAASHEQEDIESCGKLGKRVLKIKFRAENSDLNFYSIRAEFVGGKYQNIIGVDHLKDRSESDWINFKGGSQCLKDLQVVGQAASGNGRLEVYGVTLDFYDSE